MSQSQPATVHLVRHGEVYNPGGVLYARLPGFHLSSRGRQMADLLGQWFADQPLNYLASSPLERAQETMAPIAGAHPGLSVETDQRLIEADNKLAGQRFGKTNSALFNPANFRFYCNPLRPSWGEPYVELAARMRASVDDALTAAGPGGQALLVSHQLPIWVCRLSAEGKHLAHDPRRRQCRVASVTSLTFLDGRLIGVGYVEPAQQLLGRDANRPFSAGR